MSTALTKGTKLYCITDKHKSPALMKYILAIIEVTLSRLIRSCNISSTSSNLRKKINLFILTFLFSTLLNFFVNNYIELQ